MLETPPSVGENLEKADEEDNNKRNKERTTSTTTTRDDRVEEILRKLAERKERMTKASRLSYSLLDIHYHEETPFSCEITMTPVPKDLSSPKMKMYNGTTEPDDHITQLSK